MSPLKDDGYDPWKMWEDIDRDWKERKVRRDATHEVRSGSNEQHGKNLQESEKGEGSLLRLDKKGEGGVKEVAQKQEKDHVIKRKPGRPRGSKNVHTTKRPRKKNVDAVLAQITG